MPDNELLKYLSENAPSKIKLHLGCGGMRWKDFINVDLYEYDENTPDSSRDGCVADVFQDIRYLDQPDNTIDEIFTSHTLEHFYRWECIEMVTKWYNMLKPEGRLIVEMPDLFRCILWMFHIEPRKRRNGRSQLYGNQHDRLEYETHKYVWSGKEFVKELKNIGFSKVTISHKTWTHFNFRDMHVEAIK